MRLSHLNRLAPFTFAGILGGSLFLSLSLMGCGSAASSTAEGMDAGSPPSTFVAPTTPEATGSGCQQIIETYAICQDLSTCPGVTFDHAKFPDCGYSVHGASIDPECFCYGGVCPMGAPETCADMAALLSSGVTEESVCAKVATGHCQDLGTPTTFSPCQLCKYNCGGDPYCLQECGC
jgi:hypothetical protein